MRWFQRSLLHLVKTLLLVPLSPCFDIVKMTTMPLPLLSPLRERTIFDNSFRELIALSFGDFFHPRQATPSICITVMQWHGFTYFNLFKILLLLLMICAWHFLGVLFWSCWCHDIVWSTRTYILKVMWMTCCLWILSGFYDYFHDGSWYVAL